MWIIPYSVLKNTTALTSDYSKHRKTDQYLVKLLQLTTHLYCSLDRFFNKETDIRATDSSDDQTERLTITFCRINVISQWAYLLVRQKTDWRDILAWKEEEGLITHKIIQLFVLKVHAFWLGAKTLYPIYLILKI